MGEPKTRLSPRWARIVWLSPGSPRARPGNVSHLAPRVRCSPTLIAGRFRLAQGLKCQIPRNAFRNRGERKRAFHNATLIAGIADHSPRRIGYMRTAERGPVPPLRIAHILHGCRTLGPGLRTVVWVRGCARRCPGCIATPILDDGPSLVLDPEMTVSRILKQPDEEGVTFSGGEPFEQAESLAIVAAPLREAGRSVMVYSGFTLDELRSSPHPGVQSLLASTDILVDGPFVRERHGDLLWRGSANQRIHLLTPRYQHLAPHLDDPGVGVELRLDTGSHLFWAGVPAPDFTGSLRRAATSRGILLTGHEGVWA